MIGRRPAWHAGAACRDTPDFLDQNLVVQLAHCAGCPVREACLDAAIETGATLSVWGGVAIGRTPLIRRDSDAA